MSAWDDEIKVELLKELHRQGLSASQIAKAIGGVSRCAVIGKAHRMGLGPIGGGRASAPETPKVRLKAPKVARRPHINAGLAFATRKMATTPVEPVRPQRKDAEAIPLAARPWESRVAAECAFPIGDRPDIMSCCNPAPLPPAWPYCAEHLALMTRASQPRQLTEDQRQRAAARARMMNAERAAARRAA